jgi:hypothetical protein
MSNLKRTPEKATAFCAALAETCNVGKACKAVSMGRTAAYEWREADPDFAAMWDKALKIGVSALEDEAHRRGFDGVDEPLTHQGQFTYLRDFDAIDPETKKPYEVPPILMDENGNPRIATMKKYSDTLAIFLLKAHDPKYRENSKLEVSGQLDLRKLSDDEIDAELAALSAVVKAADGPDAD